ncbi:MAG: ZIP family metal transporter [Chitinispirillaceae bacterium]
MPTILWIITGGFLMSAIALVGGATAIFNRQFMERLILPLVALAAGTLLGGAVFHMIPEGIRSLEALRAGIWFMAGFIIFLALEQFLHWHRHADKTDRNKQPVTYLILIGDGLHNFLGGLGIASTFLLDPRAGIVAWFAAAAHELPQELGDFGVLIHGGWSRRSALFWNFISALAFPAGALLAYWAYAYIQLSGLVLFAAGNFVYIAASDLIPEIKSEKKITAALLHFLCLFGGVVFMYMLAYSFHESGASH